MGSWLVGWSSALGPWVLEYSVGGKGMGHGAWRLAAWLPGTRRRRARMRSNNCKRATRNAHAWPAAGCADKHFFACVFIAFTRFLSCQEGELYSTVIC